jgi:DNA-binding response OmpR family regulator
METACSPGQPRSPLRILVVDDDADILQLNAEVLKRCGYEVDIAEDGEAAWNALHPAGEVPIRYHLLITDHDMPNITGVDLLKKLRAARMELPVILATGTLPQHELERNPGLQPAAILLKPYTIEQLVSTVREVCSAGGI